MLQTSLVLVLVRLLILLGHQLIQEIIELILLVILTINPSDMGSRFGCLFGDGRVCSFGLTLLLALRSFG